MGNTAHVRPVTRSQISARLFVPLDGICVLEQRRFVLHVLEHGNLLANQPPVLTAVALDGFRAGASGDWS